MNDKRALVNTTRVVAEGRLAAHGLGETKGEKANAGHELEDEGEQTHLLAPSALLFWGADATGCKKKRRDTACEKPAVDHPGVFGAGGNVFETSSFLTRIKGGSRACLRTSPAKSGTTLEYGESRLWNILFPGEK